MFVVIAVIRFLLLELVSRIGSDRAVREVCRSGENRYCGFFWRSKSSAAKNRISSDKHLWNDSLEEVSDEGLRDEQFDLSEDQKS